VSIVPSNGGRALRALALRVTRWRAGGAGSLGAARIRALGRPVAGRQFRAVVSGVR
jgi:hypothetical protein